MTLPSIYPILDTDLLERRCVPLPKAAGALLEGGAGILQIRHKSHWSRDFFSAANTVARLCREAGATLIVNDRADFAALLDAGLHLGQEDIPPRDARTLLPDIFIGYSTHNSSQVAAAGGEPVDYVAIGPIFATRSKRNPDPIVGIFELRRCRALTDKPLVAIGGLTLDNAGPALESGADSVAVLSGLFPEQATARSIRLRMQDWVTLGRSVKSVART
jgi:thiamine-phosphate pyrophosphorylase